MRRARLLPLLRAAAFAAAILGPLAQPEVAHAMCPAPTISVRPDRGRPGSSFSVEGQYFFVGCNDVMLGGQTPEREPADRGIRIEFVQGARSWHLRTVDADSEYRFDVRARVPRDAGPGTALVRASGRNGTPTQEFIVLPQASAGASGEHSPSPSAAPPEPAEEPSTQTPETPEPVAGRQARGGPGGAAVVAAIVGGALVLGGIVARLRRRWRPGAS
ncbi:MAG: hypothetical protein HY775_10720 [Acidobacteria bacterium]|nr:hypothetical protein [Acidobacteriota bacterium]